MIHAQVIARDLKSVKKRDAELIDPNMKSGEKFKLVNEIREKSKALREAEEKVDTLKRRESQIRETCEAWKKEVGYVFYALWRHGSFLWCVYGVIVLWSSCNMIFSTIKDIVIFTVYDVMDDLWLNLVLIITS